MRLFERHSRSVSLTPAGERLQPRARAILREVESAHQALADLRDVPQGVVRIAASNTPGVYLLPHALGRFSELYPGVRASLNVLDAQELTRALQQGEVDLAVVEENLLPTRIFGWEKTPLLTDEIVLIARPDHPWLAETPLEIERLALTDMIMRPPASPMRQTIQNALADAGFNPTHLRIRFELGNSEGIKRAVQAGLGIGFVSGYAIANELALGSLVCLPIKGLRITRTLWLMRPAKQRSEMPEHFARLLEERQWLPSETVVPGFEAP